MIISGKEYSRYMGGVWADAVPELKKKLEADGYKVRVMSDFKQGRKKIYIRKD